MDFYLTTTSHGKCQSPPADESPQEGISEDDLESLLYVHRVLGHGLLQSASALNSFIVIGSVGTHSGP